MSEPVLLRGVARARPRTRPGIWLPPRRPPCVRPDVWLPKRFTPVCARNTPPSLVSYTETASWTTSGTPKTLTIPSFNAGDVIVFLGGTQDATTIGVPTATGLTFTSRQLNTAVNTCGTRLATAVAGAGGTSVVVSATNTAGQIWGFAVWVWRGSDGIGTSGEQHTTTHTVSVTPTDTHSAWMVGCFDFSAAVVTGNSITPTVSNSRQKFQNGTNYSAYVGDIVDQASGAATAYGLTAGGTTGAISTVVMEVLGTTVSASGSPPRIISHRGSFL